MVHTRVLVYLFITPPCRLRFVNGVAPLAPRLRAFSAFCGKYTHLWPRFQIELVPVTHSHSQSPALTVSTEVSTEGGDEARAEREREGTESDFDTDADKVANYWTPPCSCYVTLRSS